MDAAMGIFEGPGHVCRYVNETLRTLSGFDPVGMPAREAFPENDP